MTTHRTSEMEPFRVEAEMASALNGMSDKDLCPFVELHEDPTNDKEIELRIYVCFLIFKKAPSTEHIEQVIQRTEGWIAETAVNRPDRARRVRMLDMTSARRSQHRFTLEEAEIDVQITRLRIEAARLALDYSYAGIVKDLTAVTPVERGAQTGFLFLVVECSKGFRRWHCRGLLLNRENGHDLGQVSYSRVGMDGLLTELSSPL